MQRRLVTAFILVIAGIPVAATAAPDAAASPAAAPSAMPAEPVAPPISGDAFGGFGGARGRLQNQGIVLRGHYVGEAAANPAGGVREGTAYASEIMIGTDIDLNKKVTHSGLGTLHVTFTEREGSSLSSNAIDNLLPVQEIFGDGLTPHITELSYDQPLLHGAIDVALGRLITENDFADSPTYWGGNLYCDYQSNAICGTPIAAPVDSGYVAYPSSAWGVRVKGMPVQRTTIEAGFYEVNPTIGTRGNGLRLGLAGDTGVYLPLEADVTLGRATDASYGNIRAGGYYDTSVAKAPGAMVGRFAPNIAAQLDALPVPAVRGRFGGWLQADHLLTGGAGRSARGTAAFASAEFGDPQTSLITVFADAGIVRKGTFGSRPSDAVSVGFAYAEVNKRLRDVERTLAARGLAVPITGEERIVEANYDIQVTPWALLRPGAQIIVHPNGVAGAPAALALDLSTSITF